MSVCPNQRHDHTENGKPMRCADCGSPTHYDYGIETYVHDVDAACWLTPCLTDIGDASPCDNGEESE